MLYLRPLRTCRLQDVLKYIGEEAPAQHLPRSARGQHKPWASTRERPAPGSHGKARLSQHESATPTAPLLSSPLPLGPSPALPAEPLGTPPGRGGGIAATRPFHPTQTAGASSARLPNPGGSRCVAQPGPESPEGARRHRRSRRPERIRRAPIPVRAGDHGPSGTAAAAPPQFPHGRRERGGGNGAGEGGRGEQGTATATARRFPSGTAIGATPPAALPPATTARPALRHRPPPGHTPPARAPGRARTHPRSDTETRTNRHGRTTRTRAAGRRCRSL